MTIANDAARAGGSGPRERFLALAREALSRLAKEGSPEFSFGPGLPTMPRREAEEALAEIARARPGENIEELPFERAALFLHVSEDRLARLLSEGALPFREREGQRLIPREALLLCRDEIERQRHETLDSIVREDQEAGLCDL